MDTILRQFLQWFNEAVGRRMDSLGLFQPAPAAAAAFVASGPAADPGLIEVGLEPGGSGPTLRNAVLPGEIPLALLAPEIRDRIRRSAGDRFAGDRMYELSPGVWRCRRQFLPDPASPEFRVGRRRPA